MANTMTLARIRAIPVLLAAAVAQWLLWQAGSSAAVRVADTMGHSGRRSDPSLTGGLVVDAATTLVLVAGTWLMVATVATVVAQTAPGSVARRCPNLAPVVWRRLVIGLLGTGVLAMPVFLTGTATATGGDRGPTPGSASLHELDGLPYPDRPTAAPAEPTAPAPGAPRPVVVRQGDSLWSIAAASDPAATDAQVAGRWPQWYAANRRLIGPDPDLLIPGTVLDPPEQP